MDKKNATKERHDEQIERVSQIVEKRVKKNLILLKRDYMCSIISAIGQVSDEEIKEARSLRIKYVISEGKIRRDGQLWVQTMNTGMDPVFVEEAVFGWYEDQYSAFRTFIKGLKSPAFRFEKPSIPTRFTKDAEIEIQIYFDPA